MGRSVLLVCNRSERVLIDPILESYSRSEMFFHVQRKPICLLSLIVSCFSFLIVTWSLFRV